MASSTATATRRSNSKPSTAATPTRRSARTDNSTNGTSPRTRTARASTASKVQTGKATDKTETYDQTALGGNKVEVKTDTPKGTHSFLLMSGGATDFKVHADGCKVANSDLKKSQYDTAQVFSPESREAAIRDLWADQIAEAWDGPEGEEPSVTWLRDHGFVDSVGFHSCVKLDALPKPPKVDAAGQKRAAKTELATRAVEAIAKMVAELVENDPKNPIVVALGGPAEVKKTAAHWVHHLPADRTRWVAAGLPKPDRSDWR